MHLPMDGAIFIDLVNIAVDGKNRSIPLDSCKLLLRSRMTPVRKTRASQPAVAQRSSFPHAGKKKKNNSVRTIPNSTDILIFKNFAFCLALFHFMNAEQLKMLFTVSENGAASGKTAYNLVRKIRIWQTAKRNHLKASQIISVVTS